MAKTFGTNYSTNFSKITTDSEGQYGPLPRTTFIITIIINGITCPFTVLFNVLVILAVKRRPRLQTNSNILLACLALTDMVIGLVVQPSFVLAKTFQLLGVDGTVGIFAHRFHNFFIRAVSVCSCLHLFLVTCERLIAIKFTMRYPYIVTQRNIKMAVVALWIFVLSLEVTRETLNIMNGKQILTLNVLLALVLVFCILFISFSYVILYRETLRHQKKIKTQHLPQEEVERFIRESKALKTTVLVVGAVMLCFLPMAFILVLFFTGLNFYFGLTIALCTPCFWIRTTVMLNSLVNPLIYCWRQREMRQFVFRLSSPAVAPV